MDFFIIEYRRPVFLMEAFALLANYNVVVSLHSPEKGKWVGGHAYIKVMASNGDKHELRMAEICFLRNFHKEYKLCAECVKSEYDSDICEHITFTQLKWKERRS